MNWIDGISLGVMGLLMALGAWSGLIKAIFRLLSVVCASFGAWYFTQDLANITSKLIDLSPNVLSFISGIVLFIVILLIVLWIGNFISKVIALTPMGLFDRLAGAFLGLLKASLILIVVLNLILLIPFKGEFGKVIKSSQAIKLLKELDLNPYQVNWANLKNQATQEIQKKVLEQDNPLIPPESNNNFDF